MTCLKGLEIWKQKRGCVTAVTGPGRDLIQTLGPVPGKLLRIPSQAVLAVSVNMRFSAVAHTIIPVLGKSKQRVTEASLGYPRSRMLASSAVEKNPD